jgi:hypothetical protein
MRREGNDMHGPINAELARLRQSEMAERATRDRIGRRGEESPAPRETPSRSPSEPPLPHPGRPDPRAA